MIKSVYLRDFLSYGEETVELGGSIIAVTGENGAGKSSLLEAIPYAYYGVGRESLAGMSRIGGDGTHEVRVLDTLGVEVRRGRKASGNGFFEVYENGVMVAKGREADDWVRNYLGLDSDTFMLTVFFGLHDVRHDPLIRVTPSVRLEALQSLAEVGPYSEFLKSVKKRIRDIELKVSEAESRKDGAMSSMSDESEVQASIDVAEKGHASESKRLLKLKTKRDELRVQEEVYRAFVSERERLSSERASTDKQIGRITDDVDLMRDTLVALSGQMESDISAKKSCVEDEVLRQDIKGTRERIDQITLDIGSTEQIIDLKSMASKGSATTKCPLCGSRIDPETVSRWRDDVEGLRLEIDRLRKDRQVTSNVVRRYDDLSSEIDSLEMRISQAAKESSEIEKRIFQAEREVKVLRSDKKKKDARFVDLQEKLGDDYRGFQREVESVNGEIDECTDALHAAGSKVTVGKELLKHNAKAKKVIAESMRALKAYREEQSAYGLLSKAWNRYGIPMQLIKRTMESIEWRSTLVYQEFDSGEISVREVEDRGKPGVEFFLVDRKGERTFNQLSAGEKVMFFISVRVAIAQIISEHRRVSADYLILDEAMGNLSPKRRDDLVRLISKVLRNLFQQVIMVSHTEMRDIFTQTVRVTAGVSVSEVEVTA